MHPYLTDNPPLPSYGVMMLTALVVGWWWARRRAPRDGIAPWHIDCMTPLVVAAGLVGAWVTGVIVESLTGAADDSGSRVLLGALLVSVAAGIGWCVWHRLKLGRMGDVIAPSLALGIAIGRVGCYLAGCCWGTPCGDGWFCGVSFPAGSFAHHQQAMQGLIGIDAATSLPVHPVQLYEAAALTLLAAGLWRWGGRRVVPGEVFGAMAVGYAVVRFGLEFVRADNPDVSLGLTASQWICVAIVPVIVTLWVIRRRWYGPAIMAGLERGAGDCSNPQTVEP
ncbi:MAG: hypothetical protein GC159_03810 [Phycisphaera sp.]|nr:hypothetical protein [Phycisphaera sp.]